MGHLWPLILLSSPIRPCSASPSPVALWLENEHNIEIPGRGTKCQRDLKRLCFSCRVSGTQRPSLSPHGSSVATESWPGTNQAFLKADLGSALPLRSSWTQRHKGNWPLITDQHCGSSWFIACLWSPTEEKHDNMKPESRLVRTQRYASYNIYCISSHLFPAFIRAGLT